MKIFAKVQTKILYSKLKYDLFVFFLLLSGVFALSWIILGGVYARTHDNLDSVVVYSIVAGRFLGGHTDAFDVFVNGTVDWTYFVNSLQPLSLLYTFFSPEIAYSLTILIVLATAFFGMRALVHESLGDGHTFLIPAVFAFGLTYPSYGLGIAAAPWFIWLILRKERFGPWSILATTCIGLNSQFALHSMWQPIASIVVILLLGRPISWGRFFCAHASLFLGAIIASAGIIGLTVIGPPSHRMEWAGGTVGSLSAILERFLEDILTLKHQGHAMQTPAYFVAFVVVVGLALRKFRPVLIYVSLVAASAALGVLKPIYGQFLPEPLGTLQYDRIGQFAPLAALCLAAVLLRYRFTLWLRVPLIGTLIWFVLQTAGLSEEGMRSILPPTAREVWSEYRDRGDIGTLFSERGLGGLHLGTSVLTVSGHFRAKEYFCLGQEIAEGRVLSVGIDPMLAPANGIAALDGYHNFYPLAYKHAFRPIIANGLALDPGRASYFDDWGSRVYTFVPDGLNDTDLDWEAATSLSATHVISAWPLTDVELTDVTPDCADRLHLYRIAPNIPDTPDAD